MTFWQSVKQCETGGCFASRPVRSILISPSNSRQSPMSDVCSSAKCEQKTMAPLNQKQVQSLTPLHERSKQVRQCVHKRGLLSGLLMSGSSILVSYLNLTLRKWIEAKGERGLSGRLVQGRYWFECVPCSAKLQGDGKGLQGIVSGCLSWSLAARTWCQARYT